MPVEMLNAAPELTVVPWPVEYPPNAAALLIASVPPEIAVVPV
jgi:hypothetical protein